MQGTIKQHIVEITEVIKSLEQADCEFHTEVLVLENTIKLLENLQARRTFKPIPELLKGYLLEIETLTRLSASTPRQRVARREGVTYILGKIAALVDVTGWSHEEMGKAIKSTGSSLPRREG